MNQAEQERLEQQITAYLDGQLDRPGARQLEQRLADDPAAREILAQYAALNEQLTSLADDAPAADYDAQRQDIMAQLERKTLLAPMPQRRRVLRPIFAMAAAAVVLLVVGLSIFWSGRPEKTGTVQARVVPPPASGAEATLTVVCPRLSPDKIPPTTKVQTELPPGTVLLSLQTNEESTDDIFAPYGLVVN